VRCDDSGGCAKGETCCERFLFGGGRSVECQRPAPGAVCELSESCRPDAPCRTPGAKCVEGRCRKPLTALRCGAETCGPGQVCCGDPPACVDPSACDPRPGYRCTGPGDCLPGEYCISGPSFSYCLGTFDPVNTGVACRSDADCPAGVCYPLTPGKRPRCGASRGVIRTCECP